jgi:choline dehydrogenase
VIVPGNTSTIRAAREVVLCAGVYGSPQLLMLAGIGPAGHLRQHGITVHADLPVGGNLHDHLFVPMTYCMTSARNRGTTPYFVGGVLKEAIRHDSWMGRTVFEVVGFVRTQHAASVPDLQIHVLPWSYPFPNQDSPARHQVDKRSALTVMPTLIYPKSRGTVRLAGADPRTPPVIDPGYLTEPDDTRLLLDGMELVRATMASSLIAGQITVELSPGSAYADRAAQHPWREHERAGHDDRRACRPDHGRGIVTWTRARKGNRDGDLGGLHRLGADRHRRIPRGQVQGP